MSGFTWNDIILNAAYIIYVIALIVYDVLWLRIILALSSVCLMGYGAASGNLSIILWNLLFTGINVFQIIRLILERRPITLPEELEEIYKSVFKEMSKQEFLNFWHFGRLVVFKDELMCRQGELPVELLFIVQGRATVFRKEEKIADLPRLGFVAEMSYFTETPASADVRADGHVVARAWSHNRLHSLAQLKPNLLNILYAILGKDLAKKLKTR